MPVFLDIIHRPVFIENTQHFRDLILPLLHVESTKLGQTDRAMLLSQREFLFSGD
jgi:hypothetical protein